MTASTLLLRPYAAADHSACLLVFSSNVPRYFAVEELDEFDAFLAHPDASFLVAESGGRVVGCGGSYIREGVGRLCWGMVMQTEHRQAIGTALLVRRLGQLFAQASVDEVALDTSQHSAGFFRRFGFRTTKVTTDGFAPGIDEVSMTLNRDDWSKLTAHHLAQLNIGVIKAAMDTPVMADFANNLDRINAVAEQSPGFVWRLQTEEGDATAIRPFGDNENMLVNMSVWRDVASLNHYVYSSAHVELMRRRREWFEPMREAFLVLWWVPAGHRPTVEEAIARLELLRAQGPTAEAFTFRKAFPPPDAPSAAAPVVFEDECPAA